MKLKLSVLVVGVVVALIGGILVFLLNVEWTVPFLFWDVPAPNPLRIIPYIEPLSWIVFAVGAVLFVAGLLWKEGGD